MLFGTTRYSRLFLITTLLFAHVALADCWSLDRGVPIYPTAEAALADGIAFLEAGGLKCESTPVYVLQPWFIVRACTFQQYGTTQQVNVSAANFSFLYPGGNWGACSDKSLSIDVSTPVIPTDSRVENLHVLTKSNIALTLMNGTNPVSGVMLNLVSNRNEQDTINGPTMPTDEGGNATAEIATRNQPGSSTVTATNSGITSESDIVTWLPAKYESQFLVTCYVLSQESEFSEKTTRTKVCGLPKQNVYRSGFLSDVKMQGSGVALDGSVIRYSGRGCYAVDACARSATGACATVGTTIAVDRAVIPYRSSVQVSILGGRKAQDTGGGIVGYHIDDYMGTDRPLCRSLGRRYSDINLLNY